MRLKFIKQIRNFVSIFKKEKLDAEQQLPELTQTEWDKIEKEFLAQLYSYFSDITDSIQNLRNNEDNPFIKSQLCLAFIGADTFARFRLIFEGQRENLNLDNERRFKKWFNAFVFTNENDIYQLHKKKIKCDAEIVWRLRNSLLHFYSFPELEDGRLIQFGYNSSDALRQKIEILSEREGLKIILIDAYYLVEAILKGFLIQLQYFMKMIKNSPNQYTDAVLFAREILMNEGAFTIYFKKGDILINK